MKTSHTQDAPTNGRFVDGHGIQVSSHEDHLAEVQRRCSEDEKQSSKEEANTRPAPAKGNSGVWKCCLRCYENSTVSRFDEYIVIWDYYHDIHIDDDVCYRQNGQYTVPKCYRRWVYWT